MTYKPTINTEKPVFYSSFFAPEGVGFITTPVMDADVIEYTGMSWYSLNKEQQNEVRSYFDHHEDAYADA